MLAELAAEVANDSREAAEDSAHRLHAGLHDGFLQFAGDLIEPGGHGVQSAVAGADGLEQLVPGKDQLAGQIHQTVEHAHGNADIGVGRWGGCGSFVGGLFAGGSSRAAISGFRQALLALRCLAVV